MPGLSKRVLRSAAVQAILGRALGRYIAFVYRTTRWRLVGGEHFAPHAAGRPAIAAFWHERLPMMAKLWLMTDRRTGARTGMQILVSAHRDGRLVGTALKRFGIGAVTGSSTRGGAAGVLRLVSLIRAGNHLAITPDGPRGPRRSVSAGVAQLAALTGAPVLPCAAQVTRRWTMPSWDRMVIPKPFGRGVIVCGPPIAVPRHGWQDYVAEIGTSIDRATVLADSLCDA